MYKTALSQDSIRGLMWFQGWANSILIPRGLFYDSKLFAKMTNTNSDLMSGPLAGATIRANTNPASAHLNMRVIQMAIVKNITLQDAYRLLTLLWTNKTGNVTAFGYFATSEFHTLGFSWEVPASPLLRPSP